MGHVRVSVDAAGRFVVPKDIRDQLGISQGGELMLSVENGALVAMTRAAALRRAQAMVRAAVPPGISLADELIADRRREAAEDAVRG
jgi:AbrB family looped-hinge helix DNA binding protein